MINAAININVEMPKMILISGNGRNVGKTFLACKIIQHFSQTEEVIGLKFSPHFHSFSGSDVIFKNDKFLIVEEKEITTKDSSLMLQAGAKKVFFVMVEQKNLLEAFDSLKDFVDDKLIICESGGLRELVKPGLFLFIKRSGEKVLKTQFEKYTPLVVENDGKNFNFDIQNLEFKNNKFS